MTELNKSEMRNVESPCNALAVDHAEIVDIQDCARLREISADDTIFGRPTNPQDPLRGVDNIIASFESRSRHRLTQHFVTNIRVRVESPISASSSCRILADHGYLSDRYVRRENGW